MKGDRGSIHFTHERMNELDVQVIAAALESAGQKR
jgi:hypothetical protein